MRFCVEYVLQFKLLISFLQGLKLVFIAVILIGLVPFLLGLLFELIVVIPLRVAHDQTPLYFPWQVSVSSLSIFVTSWSP